MRVDPDAIYLINGCYYGYEELREAVESEAAKHPPETWRDGEFDFDEYLIESIIVGLIEAVYGNDLLDEPIALRGNP
jgi:hypothetical protein